MAEGDAGNGYGDSLEVVGVKFKIDVDEKGQRDSVKATSNMISLISDLALVGLNARTVLGKMWEGVQKSIDVSINELNDINEGLVVNVDSEDLKNLKYALAQINGSSKGFGSLLGRADELIQSFRNKATGKSNIADFFKTNAVYKVTATDLDSLNKAIEDEDTMGLIKAFGNLRNSLGDEFSNFTKDMGIDILKNLEIPQQYLDWIEALGKADSVIFDADELALNELSDSVSDLKVVMDKWKTAFGADIAPFVNALSASMWSVTESLFTWSDNFKKSKAFQDANASATKLLFGDDSLAKDATLLQKADNWTANLGDYVAAIASMLTKEDYSIEGGAPSISEWFKQMIPSKTNEGSTPMTTQSYNIENLNLTTSDPQDFIEKLNNEVNARRVAPKKLGR